MSVFARPGDRRRRPQSKKLPGKPRAVCAVSGRGGLPPCEGGCPVPNIRANAAVLQNVLDVPGCVSNASGLKSRLLPSSGDTTAGSEGPGNTLDRIRRAHYDSVRTVVVSALSMPIEERTRIASGTPTERVASPRHPKGGFGRRERTGRCEQPRRRSQAA